MGIGIRPHDGCNFSQISGDLSADARYDFGNVFPHGANCLSETGAPTAGSYEAWLNPKLRYVHANIDTGPRTFTLTIQAYASPVYSNLQDHFSGTSQTLLDSNTLLGDFGTGTSGKVSNTHASYNQVLSTLRCHGLLEQIHGYLTSINATGIPLVTTKIDSLITDTKASGVTIQTNNAGTTTSLLYSQYGTLRDSYTP
ncbi:MAG: hypothetical protein AAF570_22825 [Bacteroidota bacterium]